MRIGDFSFIQKVYEPKGKSILIGMLNDGPTGNPFTLANGQSAKRLLGDNELTRAYNIMIEDGIDPEDIIIFRLNGLSAKQSIKLDNRDAILFESMNSHEDENNTYITISKEGITLTSEYSDNMIDEGRRKNYQRTYRFDDYPYTKLISEEITKDAALGMHNIIAQSVINEKSSKLGEEVGVYYLEGASSEQNLINLNGQFPPGVIDDEEGYLKEYWDKYYNHLLGPDFDGESSTKLLDIQAEVLYFVDVPIDRAKEVAILSGRIAEYKTKEQGILCTSLFRTSVLPGKRVLGEDEYLNEDGTFYNSYTEEIEPWEPYKEKDKFIKKLENLFTQEERNYPEMKNVQIIVGDERNLDSQVMPGATYHLLKLVNQELYPTQNLELTGFSELNEGLNKIEVEKLQNKGYICIVDSIRRRVVTTKVLSVYNQKSLLDNFYYQKILSYYTKGLEEILDKYIGDTISSYNKSEIEDIIDEYTSPYVAQQLFKSYSLGEKEYSNQNNRAKIDIEIEIYGVIESINTDITLKKSGWEVDLWQI